jgi:hypothetical protein
LLKFLGIFRSETGCDHVSTAVVQAIQPELLVSMDPALAGRAREADRLADGRSCIALECKKYDANPFGFVGVLLNAFELLKLLKRMTIFNLQGDLLK